MHYKSAKANDAAQKEQRKALRNNMTPAEALLWRSLRASRAGGWKWRRQQGIGPFVLDFYCPALRLCIELDGSAHDYTYEYDEQRTAYLNAQDIRVVRFTNDQVFNSYEGVVAEIIRICSERNGEDTDPTPAPPLEGRGEPRETKKKNNNLKVNIIMKQLKKTLLTLVALLAVTTGAWADETPLLTIESKDYTTFLSGSKTFDDKVTVTFSNFVYYDGEEGWYADGDPSLLTVAGTNGYTITSCKFYTANGEAETGYTIEGKSPSVYLSEYAVFTDANKSVNIGESGVKKIEVYTVASSAPAASSGPEVAWDKAKNSGTFTMPGGNVTLQPEYYPQAALTAAPTAINDVPATTDGAIVSAGTVASIGETTTAQGTLMYYVSQSALDDAALLALAADAWKADVPTAKSLAAGQAYVYYYVRGNDSDTDAENFSDGDILAANALTVTIAAAPTYAVTFADGVNPEPPAQPEWTASPNAGVTKGETVTVTYTGTKKVIGVKAEKKAAVPVTSITLNKTATSIKVGATETLSVTAVAPDNATDKTYTWKTSDASKATVDQDGKVTAVAAGTVTIYAEANDGSGVKGNCTVTVTPATITVTWNNDDITTGTGYGTSFTKDGVTITAGFIDFMDKNFMEGGTFTTTLGNFTKIEVSSGYCSASGTGWSGDSTKKTWTGNASSVSFSGDFMGMGTGKTKLVFTIEPKN